MSIHDVCRRCGHAVAWIVRPVRELNDRLMIVEWINGDDGESHRGWYEAAVCAGCGLTQFFARDYDAGRAAQPIDPCLECGGTNGWTVAEAPDVVSSYQANPVHLQLAPVKRKLSLIFGGDGWRGTLAVRICAACGAAAWFCRPEDYPAEDKGKRPPSERACLRCQGVCTTTRLNDQEDAEEHVHRRAVFLSKPNFFGMYRRGGHFEVDVCLSCFAADWYGTDLHQLVERQEDGIYRVTRGGDTPDGGGPYR
jgi:hypothetical protein